MFFQNKQSQSWYDFGVKRNVVFAILISATVILAGCNPSASTSPQANSAPVNLPAEIARAKTENKLLLLEFGSSDSCPPCIELEHKVFSKPEFSEFARSNLVFVRLDYPERSKLAPAVAATNTTLEAQFSINGFPTFIAVNYDGKEFWRSEGVTLRQTDPKEFIALVKSVRAQLK
jgi:thioredoxin-related protein